MSAYPCSAYNTTSGLLYFARMCDKIRLEAAGQLAEDYLEWLGKGFDARMCGFLRADYAQVKGLVLAGASDEQALAFCLETFGPLEEIHLLVWNSFSRKRGWQDDDGGTATLERFKEAGGFADHQDIVTYFDFYDLDEGRRA